MSEYTVSTCVTISLLTPQHTIKVTFGLIVQKYIYDWDSVIRSTSRMKCVKLIKYSLEQYLPPPKRIRIISDIVFGPANQTHTYFQNIGVDIEQHMLHPSSKPM